uniref:NACHT domain-containing protein n=1 Tax=Amphimedon queenslandica TaxID=400682 RepID=A0A1X7SGZ6_AMPQE
MWSNGRLVHQQYDLLLYCPLRNSKIATATTLADLFEYRCYEVPMVAEWFEKRNGEGLLIIFDGWDELSEQLRQSSLAASIIHRKQLNKCSVIVTSRSYASSSLLKMDTLSRHVQVIGFSKEEISTVIIQTLQKDTKLAQKIIQYLHSKSNIDSESDDEISDDEVESDDELVESDDELVESDDELVESNDELVGSDDELVESNGELVERGSEVELPTDKDSQLAVKLINDLKLRNDVQSLCYVPLVCSMVILVYCKEGGHLPTTLTQLYQNFILQTIRRHLNLYKRCVN